MANAPNISAGTVVAGRYRVRELIGSGGMGAVYLVEHVATEEKLALKVLTASARDPATLTRFAREARAPGRIDSEHVVRVTDAGTAPDLGNVPYLVMEYLRGRDLRHLLAQRGHLTAPEVVAHLGQAASALDKAHPIGIVHRDLKPDNLFLAEREGAAPCIKILDFGIAKLVEQNTTSTQTGAVLGTPAFMSPEQARGDIASISGAADVWALGLIAFQLLTGNSYWAEMGTVQVLAKLLFDPIAPPSSRGAALGPAFDAWFAVCCAREPERRFRTAGEAVGALATALGVARTGPPPTWTSPPMSLAVTAAGPPPRFTYPSPADRAPAPGVPVGLKIGIGLAVFVLLATLCGFGALIASRATSEARNAPPTSAPAPPPVPAPVPTRHLSAPAPAGLDALGMENFATYLQKNRHKAFAVSDRGHYGWRAGKPTLDEARADAMRFCVSAGGRGCRIYMVDDTVIR